MKKKSDIISAIHLIGDLILLNFSFFLINYINKYAPQREHMLVQFLYLNLFWIIATTILKTYKQNRVMRITTTLNILIVSLIIHLFLIFSFISILKQPLDSVKIFVLKYFIFTLFIIVWRIFTIYFLKNIRERGYNYRRVIIIGGGQVGKDIDKFFQRHPEYGYKCLGFFDDNTQYENRLGPLHELETFAIKNTVDEIYCSLSDVDDQKVQELISFTDNNFIRLKLIPDFRSIGNYKVDISFFDQIPILNIRNFPLENIATKLLKRSFDVLFSLFIILTIFPWLFPLIILGIKLSSRGPVFFKQLRSGKNNKSFLCYKFRTMAINSSANKVQASINDPRITSFGGFLRRKSLDELPQFFNVLIGNMSVVGPRPHMLYHTKKYSKEIDNFMLRHFVKGGLTGLAQIKGFRGETKNLVQMQERLKLDIWYIENWTFYLDVNIIFQTIIEILANKNNGA